MKLKEAEENHWRCPDCKSALEESRGDYYCPSCTFANALQHKRHGGLKLGHNLTTALLPKRVLTEQRFEEGEISKILDTKYKGD